MSDIRQREWRFYLDDMINFAGKVLLGGPHSLYTKWGPPNSRSVVSLPTRLCSALFMLPQCETP